MDKADLSWAIPEENHKVLQRTDTAKQSYTALVANLEHHLLIITLRFE